MSRSSSRLLQKVLGHRGDVLHTLPHQRSVKDDRSIVSEETLVHRMGRVRDVRQGLDGFIYVAIVGEERGDTTPIYRLEPAEAN